MKLRKLAKIAPEGSNKVVVETCVLRGQKRKLVMCVEGVNSSRFEK